MATRRLLQTSLILISLLAASDLSAKKSQRVILDWKQGILWETPDPCNETSPIWKQTFLILADDTVYHVAYTPVLRKPNVTEGKPVEYDLAQDGFYLKDDDGRVFRLSIVKTEVDPTAQARFHGGILPCQPQ